MVFLLDQFFDQQISNIVINEINARRFTTNAVNVALLPNTFLYSVNSSGGIGACCTIGFHTYFTNNATPKESRWIFGFASWISPGVFAGGLQDVTALSHELSEIFNDPFLNNLVPAWQFPNEPGTCQNDLEVGDPVEVLANTVFPVHVSGFTYHPQTEALLQWFEQKSPSSAISGAFSYPNTKAAHQAGLSLWPAHVPVSDVGFWAADVCPDRTGETSSVATTRSYCQGFTQKHPNQKVQEALVPRFFNILDAICRTLACSGTEPFGVSLSTSPGRTWAMAPPAMSGEIPALAASAFT